MKKAVWKKFLVDTASGAGNVLMAQQKKALRIKYKPGAGIVTQADTAAESFILKKILRKFPKSSIITEESGEIDGSKEMVFIIDPLDGTTNYAHRFPWFAVSIGLQIDGEMVAGVIFNPAIGEMFYGEIGCGATLNGKTIRVSRTRELKGALLGTGFYYSKGPELEAQVRMLTRLNNEALGVRRPGAAALDLAYVARGVYDGFWEKNLSSWDVAAGFVLVKEAGGILSNYRGKNANVFDREILATNKLLHRKMVSILKTQDAF